MSGGGRVLIVDDDAESRAGLAAALERDGHTVLQATNGRHAVELLQIGGGDQPAVDGTFADVVLVDLTMPEMDGFETLAAIRADVDVGHLPVIVVSADGDRESVIRSIEMGATDFIAKPVDPGILAARVRAGLVDKRVRDLELVYMEHVEQVIDAAGALEAGTFDPEVLARAAARDDELGRLARSFSRMASELRAREQRLLTEVQELRDIKIEIDQARQARQVAEITGSDYFQELRGRAQELRRALEE